jgi:putative phosphoesterase
MKLGILSDSHNNLTFLKVALTHFRQEGASIIIHCGDMTTPETAACLHGFQVIHVCGNGDYASGQIHQTLFNLNPKNFSGQFFGDEIDGKRIAVTHGHLPGKLLELAETGIYDYIFTGHSHRRRIEQVAATRVINPGAVGGLRVEERSIYLLDLASGEGKFIFL